MSEAVDHYRQPGWLTTNVFNRGVAFLTRHGLSIWGSRELRVRGRKTGEWRTTPVNLLAIEGHEYLVAPRGETQWVRNIRVEGGGELRVGRKIQPITVTEVTGEAKVEVLRAYLRRWKLEVGVFFDGTSADSTDEEIAASAPKHPIFEVQTAA